MKSRRRKKIRMKIDAINISKIENGNEWLHRQCIVAQVISIDLFGLNDSQNIRTDLHFIEASRHIYTFLFYLQVPIGWFQIKFCTIFGHTSHSRKFWQNFISITVRHVWNKFLFKMKRNYKCRTKKNFFTCLSYKKIIWNERLFSYSLYSGFCRIVMPRHLSDDRSDGLSLANQPHWNVHMIQWFHRWSLGLLTKIKRFARSI